MTASRWWSRQGVAIGGFQKDRPLLKAYTVFDAQEGPREGALIVFAHTAREARNLGGRDVRDWFGTDWVNVRAEWLRDWDGSFQADPVRLAAGVPHVIDSPEGCEVCECWFITPYDENGCCPSCAERKEFDLEEEREIEAAPHG